MKDAADLIIPHYERHALAWDDDRRSAPWTDKYWIDRFLDLLPAGGHVLDIGCGGGSPVAAHTVAHGFHITGVDSSPTLISLCKSRLPDEEWIVADMRLLSLGRRFDGVLAWDSFFHLRHADQEAMSPIFRACGRGRRPHVRCRLRTWRRNRRMSRRSAVPCQSRRRRIRGPAGTLRFRADRAYGRRSRQRRAHYLDRAGSRRPAA